MKVAIVHDYLTQRGGAERVVLSMMKAFPSAPLHTALFHPEGTYPAFAHADVHPLALNHIGVLRRHHRLALPLLAPAFSAHNVDADVVLCSSSGWAHGVRATGRKVVYCYAPARWLYQGERYLGDSRSPVRHALGAARPWLVGWDRRKAQSADRYLTLSTVVRDRIREHYGIDAEVLPPPHTIDAAGDQRPVAGLGDAFFLCVSRLLAYKNVDAVVAAFSHMPGQRLVVVGQGPERGRLSRLAGPNVTFLGAVDDAQLRWLYASCAGIISASHEDYGLTPLEAASFGKPASVLRGGGFLDTVVEGVTGVFFDNPTASEVAAATNALLAQTWSADDIRAHADAFGEERFVRRLRDVVNES